METILAIGEAQYHTEENESRMSGYYIRTDNQVIKIGIQDYQNCRERFGHLASPNDFGEFLGAKLIEIKVNAYPLSKVVDEPMGTYPFEDEYLDRREVIFINLETSKGTLQFTLYNYQNAYSGHNIQIKSTQLNLAESI